MFIAQALCVALPVFGKSVIKDTGRTFRKPGLHLCPGYSFVTTTLDAKLTDT